MKKIVLILGLLVIFVCLFSGCIDDSAINDTAENNSIMISENAINVTFQPTVNIHEDGKIHISGTTNLFDHASLMLTIRGETGTAQDKTIVLDNKFEFATMSSKGEAFPPGVYNGTISVSLPGTQPKEFVEKAGKNYENLTGPWIREGSGPSIRYEFQFEIK